MARLTAVAYARYSSDKQQESSITVQLAAIHKFCDSHNIHLIHEYVDEAQTGTNANRKQFQEMIAAAPDKEFQLVVVHRMDRWARNVDDARHYKKLLARYGVKVISAVEEFDESPEGEFFELLSMGMAELYSKKLARESLAGKLANVKLGRIHGGMPMLGYKTKGKYYVIEEEEAKAVKIMFQMAAEGYGYRAIRDYLNENGYRRADGRKYTAHLTDILRCRKYIGEYIYNRLAYRARGVPYNSHKTRAETEIIRIPNGMPRIIDDETFYKVQYILDLRKQGMAGFQRARRKYLLAGLLKCKKCGFSICGTVTISHQRELPVYMHRRDGNGCGIKHICTEYLDDYIWSLFFKCLLNPVNSKQLQELVKVSYIHAIDGINEKKRAILDDIQQIRVELKSFAKKLAENDSRALSNFYSEEIERLNTQIRLKEIEIRELEQENAYMPRYDTLPIERKARSYRAILQSKDFPQMQKALRELIQVVRIGNDTVETTVQFQSFLGSHYPITATVIEARDSIALLNEWDKRVYEFSQLTVRLDG